MKKLVTLVLCTLSLYTLRAATYYASPDGKGDGSSYFSPTTFAAGVSKLNNPGDTLYLKEGTYLFTDKFSINKQGSASKRIVIAGYPGDHVVLDFHKVPYGTRGITVHANSLYVHIKDLAIAYSGKNNLYNEGSYCLFENLDIYGSADTGCQMKKGGNNTILNVDSHDNFDYKTMSGSQANFGGNADGFADKQFTGAGNHYIGCRAWNNSDDGWDFFQRVSNTQTVIEYCVCYQNGPAFYNMKKHPRYETDKSWFDSKVGTQMTDRYGQTITVTLEKYPCQGNGNGFKMGGQYTDHKILIHHSLAVANNARGFDQNNNGGTMWVYNNSAYDNGVNFGFTTAYGTNYIQNNVSLSGRSGDQPKSQTVAANDHNTWNNGLNCTAADFLSLDTTEILAPRTGAGSFAQGTFMRLAQGSKLINAGIDVNIGYNGSAPDLGCYETDGERHDPIPDEDTIPAVQPEGTHAVAFVTIPKCAEDKPLLHYLRQNDSLWIVETDATDPETDYSGYEIIVLGGKPNSAAVGFAALKGYDKTMLLLKPFLLKPNVWSWGVAVNTQDLSITVHNPSHPLFQNLTLTGNQLQLFSDCNTNAVTAISEWTNTQGAELIASPVSQPTYTTIAELPAGTNCNGTVLPKTMLMVGVSEYSTALLTTDGKHLIENAICYLLGIPNTHIPDPEAITTTDAAQNITNKAIKFIENGKLYIQTNGHVMDVTGRIVR
ncbi:MAG: hypothetical protein IKQ48_03490 [Paludibacteraceae bacterium]|nr:hypothetical protein [Paludibacteraceae bacterium]